MRRPSRRRVIALVASAVVVAVLAVLVAFAIRWIEGETGPVVIEPVDVPYALLDEAGPQPSEPSDPASQQVTLYLVFGDALVPVERVVPRDATPLDVVRLLVQGPTSDEVARGLTTYVTPDADPADVDVRADRAVVALTGALQVTSNSDRRTLAIAQLVYTLTALPGIDRVVFELDGARAEVPAGDGTLVRTPLQRSAFPVQVLATVP